MSAVCVCSTVLVTPQPALLALSALPSAMLLPSCPLAPSTFASTACALMPSHKFCNLSGPLYTFNKALLHTYPTDQGNAAWRWARAI